MALKKKNPHQNKSSENIFFPFYSPVVWVQFHNIYPGVLITIECKLWAKNIQHDPKNPMVGGVRLELLMD